MEQETHDYLIPIVIVIIICILSYLYSFRRINIQDILDNHYYINLDQRKDRNESTIHELSKIGIKNPHRFSAIKHKDTNQKISISYSANQ